MYSHPNAAPPVARETPQLLNTINENDASISACADAVAQLHLAHARLMNPRPVAAEKAGSAPASPTDTVEGRLQAQGRSLAYLRSELSNLLALFERAV